ncbi:MAG: GNAT family N-acetyltransferase [Psychrobium sp.]
MYSIEQLPAIMIPLANKYYKTHKVGGSASGNNIVMVARKNGNIVGIARLAPIQEHWFLTGVHVAESERGQGIASQLIKALCGQQPQVYSFPYQHLEAFYNNLGFTLMPPEQIPSEIAARFVAYSKQGRKIVAMIK